jgi:hypothetical protein
MRGVLAACLTLCACAPTTARITVREGAGESAPSSLSVSVFDARRALQPSFALPAGPLPGTFLVELPDLTQTIRIAVDGPAGAARQEGAVTVPVVAHQESRADLTLSAATADRDGDGVPDAIDDCPDAPNAEQADADGDGRGDVCQNRVFTGGASRCPGGFLLCDGFESGLGQWTLDTTGGAVTVDAAQVARGAHAALFHGDGLAAGNSHQVVIATARVSYGAAQPLFIRAFVFLPSGRPASGINLLNHQQSVAPYGGATVGIDDAQNLIFIDYANGNVYQQSSTALTTGAWRCLEWELSGDGANGASHVWLDDAPVADLAIESGLVVGPAPPFGDIQLGLIAGAPAQDLWLDEIAIDTTRIGCAR